MKTIAELYPQRRRETNVELIKGVRDATSQEAFEAADAAVAGSLHPSLLAELDFMEMTMPRDYLEGGRRLVDGLFHQHFPAFFEMRRKELDLDAEGLLLEVAGNAEYYRYLLEEQPDLLDGNLEPSVREALRAFEQSGEELLGRLEATHRAELAADVAEIVRFPPWMALLASVAIQNTLLQALDHLSSRTRTKQFLRAAGGTFPVPGGGEMETAEDLARFAEELRSLASYAREYRLSRLAALCEAVAEASADAHLESPPPFAGERAAGSGPCERCSMVFASSAIISLDPTCPGLQGTEAGDLYLPLEFNVAICPFCGHEARVDSPSMFYSPQRNQVIYNLPTHGRMTEDQAMEVSRPVIEELRRRYLSRVGDEQARAFDRAAEELTYSVAEFMNAIHMGTTATEEHVCNVVRLADGSGLLVDRTKGVLMSLTRAELAGRWASGLEALGGSAASSAPDPGPGATMAAAMKAFEEGDLAGAGEVLEALLEHRPADDVVRRNLAAVRYAQGDRQAAREILGS